MSSEYTTVETQDIERQAAFSLVGQRQSPYVFVKRALDIVMSAAGLILLFPLLVYVAVRIKREDGGPVIFVQERVGLNGEVFKILKFRSMVMNADAALETWKKDNPDLFEKYVKNNYKLEDDPRITRIGRLIRRTSIDELPQLFNVLRGNMSLVGPRPLLVRELPAYGAAYDKYVRVRPGITCIWQVSGRSLTTFEARASFDAEYVDRMSLATDLRILFKTVKVVVKREGAY